MKILMVCLGNICRSPIAHGIMEQRIKDHGLDWTVDSAGTNGYHDGELPDRRSIEISKKHGIDITNQRSRQIKSSDFDEFDHIFVMDDSNYEDVISLTKNPKHHQKVRKLCELTGARRKNVPDPYYDRGTDGFEYVFNLVDTNISAFIGPLIEGELRKY